MSEPFSLTEHERAQGLWLRLRAHLEDRLADLRVRNDGLMSEYETASLRGEIKGLKRLIALDAARPIVTGDDEQPP